MYGWRRAGLHFCKKEHYLTEEVWQLQIKNWLQSMEQNLLPLPNEKNINFLFEASVGGGIPIIRPLVQCLTADVIEEVSGILNGTTNYMLTRMKEEGMSFEEALKEAQEKGYAELHPEADVEGYDACRKIAILSSLAFGQQVDFEDIYTEGITSNYCRRFPLCYSDEQEY